MSMLTLAGAYEFINETENIVQEADNVLGYLEVAEAYFDADEAEKEVTETLDIIDKLMTQARINESLIVAAESYGWSKGMVAIADIEGSLQAKGVIPSIESLSDNESVVASTEGLKDMWTKFWTAIKNFFAKLGRAIGSWFTSLMNFFSKNSKALQRVYDKYLKKISSPDDLEKDKYEKVKVKVPKFMKEEKTYDFPKEMETSSTQMKQLINILQSSAARADKVPTTLTKQLKNLCESVNMTKKFEVNEDKGSVKIEKETGSDGFASKYLSTEKINLKDIVPMGDVTKFIDKVDEKIKWLEQVEKEVPVYTKALPKLSSAIEKFANEMIKAELKDKKDKNIVKVIVELQKFGIQVIKDVFSAYNKYGKALVSIAIGIAKARKVGESTDEDED